MQRVLLTTGLFMLCSSTVMANFDSANDLISLHFDNAPDRDDVHSAAAGYMVTDDFGIEPLVINGTYGTSNASQYMEESAEIVDDIWVGESIDAASDRDAAINQAYSVWSTTFNNGGEVWVAEGGSSDLTAAVVRRLQEDGFDTRSAVHIVQNSQSNEDNANPDELAFVKDNTDYIRIDNGDEDNNTAILRVDGGADSFVSTMDDSDYSYEWEVAFDYLDSDEKLDFSDTVALLHILGVDKSEVANVTQFANRFAGLDTSESDDASSGEQSDSSTDDDTGSEVDSATEESTEGEDDSVAEDEMSSDDDSATEGDTASDDDSATEENTASEDDSATNDDSAGEGDSATEGDTAGEDDSTTGDDTAGEDDSATEDDTAGEAGSDDEEGLTEDNGVAEDGENDNADDDSGNHSVVDEESDITENDSATPTDNDTDNVSPRFVEYGVQLPSCVYDDSDVDGDGYGWEFNSSCVVPGSGITTVLTFPVCESPLSDRDGDGWGWENHMSCLVIGNN